MVTLAPFRVLLFCELTDESFAAKQFQQFIQGDNGVIHHLIGSGIEVVNFSSELTSTSKHPDWREYKRLEIWLSPSEAEWQSVELVIFIFGRESLRLGALLEEARLHKSKRMFIALDNTTHNQVLRSLTSKEEELDLHFYERQRDVCLAITHKMSTLRKAVGCIA